MLQSWLPRSPPAPSAATCTKSSEAYERNGVCEYIVWRVDDHEIDWFVLRNSRFEKLAPDEDGTLRSTVLPGLMA